MIEKAGVERLDGWMALVRRVRDEFPGLETEELLMEHRRTVEKFMRRGEAICAVQDGLVVGALLYSVKKGLLCFLAVHPDARRRGIAREMVQRMLREMPGEVRVQTFCEGDARGRAARRSAVRLAVFDIALGDVGAGAPCDRHRRLGVP